VRFPTSHTPISQKILSDYRFRFFEHCIGAVDGTHIRVFSSNDKHVFMRNHKGFLSQNCLFICDFDFDFIYSLCGWDGSVADAALWKDAVENDIEVPAGKYLLGDAGFASCDALLVPYHGVRYHLKEWCQGGIGYVESFSMLCIDLSNSGCSPRNSRELFNLRHAALRNIIEHIFGVLKRQWRILNNPPEYSMDIQARLPAGLCALHNFINHFDPDAFYHPDFDADDLMRRFDEPDIPTDGGDDEHVPDGNETERAGLRRNAIAQAMWDDYLAECTQRGIPLPT